MNRILANILVLFSLFLLPFWCTILVCLVFSLIFDFIEIVFFGFLFDVVYGFKGGFLETNTFTLGGIVLYAIIFYIKPYLKM